MNWPTVSVIVIGRNEGERLARCLKSVRAMDYDNALLEVFYADSGSTDGSPDLAAGLGAHVLAVPPGPPSAARGRNLGYQHARGVYLFFVDGDTVIAPGFLKQAVSFLEERRETAVVWGHRRELRPGDSVYNRVLDLDWIYPPGETAFCGGDAVMRKAVLDETGPFREALIAGEEPELCARIRAAGYRVHHLDIPMTGHDLAIKTFGAYWRRCFRAGHAYAEVARRTRGQVFGRDVVKNQWQTIAYLALPTLAAAFVGRHALWLLPLGALAMLTRTVWRARWRGASAATIWLFAVHSHLSQFPILLGQWYFHLNRLRRKHPELIEYKK